MKWLGYTLTGIFAVTVLFAVSAIALLATFDPNDYKSQIADAVQNATGRTLILEGPISLTYYPVFGFTVSQASLGNPEGFGSDTPFAAIEELQAGVKIVPLLSGIVEFDSIRALKPEINLVRRSDGSSNMDFQTNLNPEASSSAPPLEQSGQQKDFALSVGAIEIADASLHFEDQQSGQTYVLAPVNFKLSSFAFSRASAMTFDAGFKASDSALMMQGSSDVSIEQETGIIRLSEFNTQIGISNPALSRELTVRANGNAVLDVNSQNAALEKGRMTWDETAIDAQGAYHWGSSPKAEFSLSAETIDLDQILAVMAPRAQTTAAVPPQPLPVAALRNLHATGTIKVETLRAYGLTFTNFDTALSGAPGLFDFDPITLSLYDGAFSGKAHVDARGSSLRTRESGKFENIQMGGVLRDLLGQDYISGTGNLEYDLQSAGDTIPALIRDLGGSVAFDIGDGYINHWQLSQRINQAITFFETGQLSESTDEQVRFTSLSGLFQGQNGVFRNDDLTMVGLRMHTLGSGNINLANQTVDYTVRAGLGDDPAGFATAKHLPITISGPLSAPRYGLDVQALIRDQAQEKIEEKKQEFLGKALNKLGIQQEQTAPSASDTGASEGAESRESDNAQPTDSADEPAKMLKKLFGN